MPDLSQLAQQHSQQTGIPSSVYLALIQHENDPAIPLENYPSKYNMFGMLGTRGTADQQFNQFDQLMFNSRYGAATQQLLQTGNIPAFFNGIAYAGYAAPSDDRPTWVANLSAMAAANGGTTSPRSASLASLPTPVASNAAPPTAINTVWGPVYRTIDQIRGTPYQSPQERMYFLQSQGLTVNSIGQVVPLTTSGGRNAPRIDSGSDSEPATNVDVTPATIDSGVASVSAPGGSQLAGGPEYVPAGGMFGNQTTVNNAIAQATMAGVNQSQVATQQAAAEQASAVARQQGTSQAEAAGIPNQGSEVAAAMAAQGNEVFPGGS